VSIHLELAALIEEEFSGHLDGPLERCQDALRLRLNNGVQLTIRYADPLAYSLRWEYEGLEAGIDTAPLHEGLATFPHHYHGVDGQVLPDPLTSPERSPADNLRRVLSALVTSPVLRMEQQA
jgi:hypothetical protein